MPSFHPNAANAALSAAARQREFPNTYPNQPLRHQRQRRELAMPSRGSPEIPSPIRAFTGVRAPLQGSGPSRSNPACRNTRRSFPAIRSRCVHSVHGQSRHDSPSHPRHSTRPPVASSTGSEMAAPPHIIKGTSLTVIPAFPLAKSVGSPLMWSMFQQDPECRIIPCTPKTP